MMNRIERIALLIIVSATVLLTGCSDQNMKNTAVATFDEIATADQVFIEADNASIEGTWVGDFETWVFRKNGSGMITENNGDDRADFDYEIEEGGESILFHVGSPEDKQKATCKLSEYVLILDFGDGRYFELRKK